MRLSTFWIIFLLTAGSITSVLAKEEPALKQVAIPFGVREVRLLDGPFQHAQELDAKYLLTVEPDRMLSWFRKEAKLEPKGQVYGGWESMGIAGHSLGHYLSACARKEIDTHVDVAVAAEKRTRLSAFANFVIFSNRVVSIDDNFLVDRTIRKIEN